MKDEVVSYSINGHDAQGYLVIPESYSPERASASRGGVVVIQEWCGLNDNIKDITRRVAELGYVAIAPDLYNGQVAKEPDEAQKLRMEIELGEAVKKISAAAKYLKQDHGVSKVACMGFCMGGTLTILASTTGEFVAAVPFYGRIVDEIKLGLDKIKIPVLGFYGTQDHGIPVESVEGFKKELDQRGVVNEFHFYSAGHAFFNDTRPESYNEQASKDAWEKVKRWFKKYLE